MTTPVFAEGMRVSGEFPPGTARLGTVLAVFPKAVAIQWDPLTGFSRPVEDTYDATDIRIMDIRPLIDGERK